MSNKSNGTAFERELAQMLSDNGFWVHCLKDNQNGQPFDVIASRNGNTFVFDCKDCQGDKFLLNRIEENQHNAMTLWSMTGNAQGLFAIKIRNVIFLIPHRMLTIMKESGTKQVGYEELFKCGRTFTQWVEHKDKMDVVNYMSKKGREVKGIMHAGDNQ